MKCQFCGSEKIKIETPYIDAFGEKIMSYCCNAQKKNIKYADAHTSRLTGERPSTEEVGKW